MHTENIDLKKQGRQKIMGPLTINSTPPYHFMQTDGSPVFLTGSHNWSCFQECFSGDLNAEFDFPAYLTWLEEHNHNFIRGWHWEQTSWDQFTTERVPLRPLPFLRTGPGVALDGLPKFDCAAFNDEYFTRLKTRVGLAAERGFYVSVMLFEGWSSDVRRPDLPVANPWKGHPFHGENNINGLDGDSERTGSGRDIHTLRHPDITACQERYVTKVLETLNGLDNVLYEIGNEHYEDSYPWQEHMVQFIHAAEADMPKQHPVGITSGGGGDDAVTNDQLLESSADWIAPRERNEVDAPYRDSPPVPDGGKGVFADTDHLWGLGGYPGWVWKSFTRGLNVLLMDCYEPIHGMDADHWPNWGEKNRRDHPIYEPIRNAMGYARTYACRMNLATCLPEPDLSSSGFCLAAKGSEYLVYTDSQDTVTVTLPDDESEYVVEWLNPATGELARYDQAAASGNAEFTSPFGGESVLYLRILQ